MSKKIIYKTLEQISNIRESGKYLTELLVLLKNHSKAGVSLIELEEFAQNFLDKKSIKGAFKGYGGFPANLCLSVNDCVVHGIPDKYVLRDGDLLKIDLGIDYKGGISDGAISMIIGGNDKNKLGYSLIQTTKKSLDESLKHVFDNNLMFDYSNSVYNIVKSGGYDVIRSLTGHGVGTNVHEGPFVYNRPHPETKNIKFRENMILALEPITAIKSSEFIEKPGVEWNLYTKNKDLGAQWEYTILVKKTGYEILAGITDF